MPGERAKDNKTLTVKCASCGKETPTDLMAGLEGGEGRVRKVFPVCRPCYEKGWRPPGYRGF
ncbi:MAG: hypothetical protein ACREQY_04645 [Candidatus Binatia bacterium]